MADFLRPTQQKLPPTDSNIAIQSKSVDAKVYSPGDEKNYCKQSASQFSVRATKKGGVPVVVESRKHHRVVVLSNVEGDVTTLLSALQKLLGTGGVCRGNSIEIQGEHHLEKIKKFCLNSGCVVGASKQNKAEAALGNKKGDRRINEPTFCEKNNANLPIDATALISNKEIKTMKPTQLKEHLAARQLSTQGNKKELQARLLISMRTTN